MQSKHNSPWRHRFRPSKQGRCIASDMLARLRSLGWIEGKNMVFEHRPAVVQKVTRTIPIVTLTSGDLVASGIVPSLARPAGNIIGMQSYAPEMMGKRLQMLKECILALSRVAAILRLRACCSWGSGRCLMYRKRLLSLTRRASLNW